MKKIILIFLFLFIKPLTAEELQKAYFAGGCFWCVEEYFDKVEGVIKTTSGYSGGHVKNPTYEQVTYKDTGHVETVEVVYDKSKVDFKTLLDIHIVNIDPFDKRGQFCDKGDSYRSVIFYNTNEEKDISENKLREIEKKFNKKVATLVWKFEEFYSAEDYHQDFYQKNFIRYLTYKANCLRKEDLERIWN
jgi:peptide-methionine (S)-S-oxide reductase